MTDKIVEADVDLSSAGYIARVEVPAGRAVSLSAHSHHSATIFLHRLTREDLEAIHTAFGEYLIETT